MDLVKMVYDCIESTQKNEKRLYIGASSIGHQCRRYIWYSMKGMKSEGLNAKNYITFEIGKRLETMVLEYLEKADIDVERANPANFHLLFEDSDIDIFRGHADAILRFGYDNSVILEIKTAKNSSFERFKNKGLLQWSETYYAQLQAYMGMSDIKQGVLLAINKDNSELHCEWVNFDSAYYTRLRDKAISIHRSESEPEKINQSPLYMLCNRCSFKKICHGGDKENVRL